MTPLVTHCPQETLCDPLEFRPALIRKLYQVLHLRLLIDLEVSVRETARVVQVLLVYIRYCNWYWEKV